MTLELRGVSKTVEGQTHIYPTDLTLEKGTMNVLLGPTLSGKTSLMRLMAGLDVPATGQVIWNDQDVTGQRVQDRKVAMVYQQFINYPSMSVYDNIASPMKLMGANKAEIDARVAEMLKHGALFSPDHFADVVASSSAVLRRDVDVLSRLVATSVGLQNS